MQHLVVVAPVIVYKFLLPLHTSDMVIAADCSSKLHGSSPARRASGLFSEIVSLGVHL
jgi:hypothetical protein